MIKISCLHRVFLKLYIFWRYTEVILVVNIIAAMLGLYIKGLSLCKVKSYRSAGNTSYIIENSYNIFCTLSYITTTVHLNLNII